MENSQLTVENILCHLRQKRSNKKDIQILKLLENFEKHGCENKTQQYRVLEEFLQLLSNTNTNTRTTNDDAIGCVIWLTHLQEQQKLPCLDESQFANVLKWILEQHHCNENNIDSLCRILIALGCLFLSHPTNGIQYFVLTLKIVLEYISSHTDGILLIAALQCMDKLLNTLNDVKLSEEKCAACEEAGHKLVQLHYGDTKLNVDSLNASVVILSTLQTLHKIVMLNSNFAKLQVSELLGLSKTYFHFGFDTSQTSILSPQKVYISQQALYDSAEEIETVINSENARSCGGKTPKTRKPRVVAKNKTINRNPDNRSDTLVFDMKISDSEVSEPENATNHILFERSRNAKIRLASINLVGAISRLLERRTLYGYWHALFPNGTADSNDNLLYIAQHDPNLRCRSAALQVCSHLLYGSKGFLHQAEINIKRCPTTYIPFSVSLGYTVLAIYKALATILSSESSLPVLTQALKCLAVLVQASPFRQFEKGFVQNFVKDVKPLVFHRDAAIQVSALMVMEFLVALPETTSDIAEAVGLPPEVATKKISQLQHVADEEVDIVDIEEFVESEEDICDAGNTAGASNENCDATPSSGDTSWLLRRVLFNLTKQEKVLATSVRIESLQVLVVMSSHFAMIKPHLARVSHVLQDSLNDILPDVRLYAARCIDACAYQISRYVLDNASCSELEIRECNTFWLSMMPIIVGHIGRDAEEMSTVRISLCDALSNIGALMYEHTPHSSQINLLSFLSGVSSDSSEETIVRAAAVRALAVFALFPSLRGDLVFIENTAELTLRLVKDTNLVVRVKSFWSLGNISDALMGKGTTDVRQERISNDLLYRLITAATTACSDNDKVRCNAVRTLGNLLRLLTDDHFADENNKLNWRQTFAKSICKLTDCIRSSGNAKVKWNTCYVISNLLRNRNIFKVNDLNWQETLYSALCHVIVHHSNFKVRINATSAIANITERSHFGIYYEKFVSSVLEAIEQSYNLDNFHEYNHRDSLQEQLCLALSHIISLAGNEDLPMLKKHILPHVEIIRNTWQRVINRMVPEKAAPLLSCPVLLAERGKPDNATLSAEQKNTIDFLTGIFSTE